MGRGGQSYRVRIKAMADAEWDSLEAQVDPKLHARQHLAEMDPKRRAELEAEWK